MSLPIRKLGKREMYLKEDWATVEVEGKTYTFQRAIPGGAILTREAWRVAAPASVRGIVSRLAWVSAAIRVRSGSTEIPRVLIDGKWMAITPELKARPDFEKLIKDKKITERQERYLKASVTSGEGLDLGANLKFPEEVILTSPETAWADLETAYNNVQSPSARTDS